jgi:hypothetical protein
MRKHPMKVGGTGKTPQGKTVRTPKRGQSSMPKGLTSSLRQTEGYTPSTSLPTDKRAGGAKAREKRLMKQAV